MVERGRAAGEGKVVGQGESRGRIAGGDGTSQWLHFTAEASNQISLMKWQECRKPDGSEAKGILALCFLKPPSVAVFPCLLVIS